MRLPFTGRERLRLLSSRAVQAVAGLLIAGSVALPSQAAQLVLVQAKGCSYCAAFEREVGMRYGRTKAGAIAPLRRLSPLRSWPKDLSRVPPTRLSPIFILVDNGKEVGRFAGYTDPAQFWKKLDRLISKVN